MKSSRYISVLICYALSVLMISCISTSSEKNESVVDSLMLANDSLEQSVSDILATFNSIQSNLSEIKERQGLIEYVDINEGELNVEESILADIEIINDLMRENEDKLKSLESQLSNSRLKSEEFRQLIKNLNIQLDQQNSEIGRLNALLEEKNLAIGKLYFSVDSLKFVSKQKDNQLKSGRDQLNQAFFAIGTFKELRSKNVLSKEGGLLGIGRSEKLNDNFNKEYFTKIDIREHQAFLIYAKDAKLITNHPSTTYKFHKSKNQVDSLVISDPQEFWRASKYLVIQTD